MKNNMLETMIQTISNCDTQEALNLWAVVGPGQFNAFFALEEKTDFN